KKRKSKQDEAEGKDETLNNEVGEGKEASSAPTQEKSAEKQKKKKKNKTHKDKSSSSQSKLEVASTPSAEIMPQEPNIGTDPPPKDGLMPTIVEETSPDTTIKQVVKELNQQLLNPEQETDQTSPEKETQEREEGKKEETKEEKQETKEVGTNKDKPSPTTSQKDLVNSPLRTDITKENEAQTQPDVQQVMDPSPQKGIEETQPDLDQNNPEVEASTINEEKTSAQVELQGTPVIEASNTEGITPFIGQTTSQEPPQNMAQHDVIIAGA
ncbi:hypothetical protein A2U01_0026757, partial [Trifolium medium]|nr:hypothetical protein [Trifolium medium]